VGWKRKPGASGTSAGGGEEESSSGDRCGYGILIWTGWGLMNDLLGFGEKRTRR
jgi:hypothetical protein